VITELCDSAWIDGLISSINAFRLAGRVYLQHFIHLAFALFMQIL
jgi:hypothetical protein